MEQSTSLPSQRSCGIYLIQEKEPYMHNTVYCPNVKNQKNNASRGLDINGHFLLLALRSNMNDP